MLRKVRLTYCLDRHLHRTEWNERSNDPLSYSNPYFNHWFFLVLVKIIF